MGLRIVRTLLQADSGVASVDSYLDRIVKSIPSQVVTFYTAAIAWLSDSPTAMRTLDPGADSAKTFGATTVVSPRANVIIVSPKLWVVFVMGLILTPLLTWKQTKDKGKPPAYYQISLATLSFFVWAYATGGPFRSLWWDPQVAAVVLAFYTVLLGAIARP